MKKINLFLMCALSLGLVACGGKGNNSNSNSSSGSSESTDTSSSSSEEGREDGFTEITKEEFFQKINDLPKGPEYKKAVINGQRGQYGTTEFDEVFNNVTYHWIDDEWLCNYKDKNAGKSASLIKYSYVEDFLDTELEHNYLYNFKTGCFLAELPDYYLNETHVGMLRQYFNCYARLTKLQTVDVVETTYTDDVFGAFNYDLTIDWYEEDVVDGYEAVSKAAFADKLTACGSITSSGYKSGVVNGTTKYYPEGFEEAVTYDNVKIAYDSVGDSFIQLGEDINAKTFSLIEYPLSELYPELIRDSNYAFLYTSEDGFLAQFPIQKSSNAYVDVTMKFNNFGMATELHEVPVFMNKRAADFIDYSDLAITYSQDEATVRVTILPGLGSFDGVSSMTYEIPYNVALGAITSLTTFVLPTSSTYALNQNGYARADGSVMGVNDPVTSDITLTALFFDASAMAVLTSFDYASYGESKEQTIKFNYEVSDSLVDTPIMVTINNAVAYAVNGNSLSFVIDSEVAASGSAFNIFGKVKNISFSDENGPLSSGNKIIKSVGYYGSSLTGVKDYGCYQLPNLESFSHGSNTFAIGAHAFDGCAKLKTMNFHGSSIGEYAFANTGLEGFVVLNGYPTIAPTAFDGVTGIDAFFVAYAILTEDSYGQLRFNKSNQALPEGYDASWIGDVPFGYYLITESFMKDGAATDITLGISGGTNGANLWFQIRLEAGSYDLKVAGYGADGTVSIYHQDDLSTPILTSEGAGGVAVTNTINPTSNTSYYILVSSPAKGNYSECAFKVSSAA